MHAGNARCGNCRVIGEDAIVCRCVMLDVQALNETPDDERLSNQGI